MIFAAIIAICGAIAALTGLTFYVVGKITKKSDEASEAYKELMEVRATLFSSEQARTSALNAFAKLSIDATRMQEELKTEREVRKQIEVQRDTLLRSLVTNNPEAVGTHVNDLLDRLRKLSEVPANPAPTGPGGGGS